MHRSTKQKTTEDKQSNRETQQNDWLEPSLGLQVGHHIELAQDRVNIIGIQESSWLQPTIQTCQRSIHHAV